ncbi:unnamed protein product [Hyaloperonospora brassicae]|uniref:FLZ-type domain-containing protein n=1 Tax=Hyaloperonospora brassicae TaxID=162125 RepID=A0AAV0UPL6_HYABA|nr:unnamed protein product [Hyaloperonospora brassicae]
MTDAARTRGDFEPKSSHRGTKVYRTQEVYVSSTSLKSRMIRFIFQRTRRAQELRSKSWPGQAESVSLSVQTSASCPDSTSIETQDGLGRSLTRSASPTSRQKRAERIARRGSGDVDSTIAEWRQRQTHCANCERLFFTSLSSLRNGEDRFCSLDCKTNLEYMHRLQHVTYTQTWESSADCSVEVGDKEVAEQMTSLGISGFDHHVVSRGQSGRHCRAFVQHRVH